MMEGWMIRLLNMSFAAGCVTGIVLVLRLLFARLPKGYCYAMWLVVLFRFLCPVTLASPLSWLPVNPEPMGQEIVYQEKPEIQTGVIWIDQAVNQVMEENLAVQDPGASVNPIQIWMEAGFILWVTGAVSFGGYHLLQWMYLCRRLKTAVRVTGPGYTGRDGRKRPKGRKTQLRVWESDRIQGAFVLGVLFPSVYLPAGLSDESREYILCHEEIHVERRDYLVRLAGLIMVAVHWFNPLSWLAFRLMCADMEMSCDEKVLQRLGQDKRESYSRVLLAEAEGKNRLLLPLAFGRNHAYLRIRNILKYHKPGWILTLAGIILLAAAGIGLMTSPEKRGDWSDKENAAVSVIGGADGPTSIFVAGKLDGEEEEEIWQRERPDSQWLASVRLVPETGGEENLEGQEGSRVFLDFASDNSLIFHGDFGLFSFNKGEEGKWEQQIFISNVEMGEQLADTLQEILPQGLEMGEEAIHWEDRFVMASGEGAEENPVREFAAARMSDGRIGVLGGVVSSEGEGRLVDLFYGYYDPGQQIMCQAFLFLGDGAEAVNQKGELEQGRWLFERDGYDYYLRTPREQLPFEEKEFNSFSRYHIPYGRRELARSRDGTQELLDELVYVDQGSPQEFVLTEERIIYWGFTEASLMSVKRPWLISLCLDGSGRKTGDLRYGVAKGLCYTDGYLYYEGWSNDGGFPRPLMRVRPDFTEQEKVGDLPGTLVTVREGGVCLWIDRESEERRILTSGVESLGDPSKYRDYLETEEGKGQNCEMEELEDGRLKIMLTGFEEEGKTEVYWVR